ncbi:MAG: ankyrin repeat domain-containing protein [Vulcanimicrobiota bacterium]
MSNGTILENRYKVMSIVKSGAMGCVYKALDMRLNSVVALKQMLCSSAEPEEIAYAEKRFQEEAQLLSKLHHGGLPKVIDYFTSLDPATHKTAHYLVMTFIDGKDLETVISERKQKPFPLMEALEYFGQILEILNYLHSQNPPVIYRDLKPSNIMFHNNRIILIDFGIARVFSPQQKGTAIGTAGYTAPEQYRGSAEPRSDIYSLGVVMHYLLTGADPQESTLPLFTFSSVRHLNLSVPEDLDRLIMSMIDVVPDNRPSSVKRIIEIINNAQVKAASGPPVFPVHKAASHTVHQSPSPARLDIAGDKLKYSSIIEAINGGDIKEVKVFIEKGAYVNARTPDGNVLLHRAVILGYKDIVELLISSGADVNVRGKDGVMPLHSACAGDHKEMVELLILKGADIYAKTIRGETPLDKAEENGNKEIADFLRKASGVR